MLAVLKSSTFPLITALHKTNMMNCISILFQCGGSVWSLDDWLANNKCITVQFMAEDCVCQSYATIKWKLTSPIFMKWHFIFGANFYHAIALFADSLPCVCFVFNTRIALIRRTTKLAGHAWYCSLNKQKIWLSLI